MVPTGIMTARLPAPTARLSALTAATATLPHPVVDPEPPAGASVKTLLSHVMRVARIAVIEAVGSNLELVSVESGAPPQPFGLTASQLAAGAPWSETVYPPDREALRAHIHDADTAGRGEFVDYRIIVSEGELLWVRHWTLERRPAENEEPSRFLILIMPIPEQKHLEWECLRVSERECNRIGQELHDDLCQVLAGLTFMMRVVGQRARSIDATLAAEIEEFNAHLVGATDRVRSMAHGLFPAQLKYSTLRHALTAFAAEARTLFAVEVTLSIPRKLPRHTPEMIVHVYRIAQEAVSNAVRHGRATRVSVVLTTTQTGVSMRISDDGAGLPDEAQRPEGIGMHVMQYRARVLGGTLSIENTPPRGVAVCLSYPVGHPAPATNTQPPEIS